MTAKAFVVAPRLQSPIVFASQRTGPSQIFLSEYAESNYVSIEECLRWAKRTSTRLTELLIGTGLDRCTVSGSDITARHLILDRYPTRMARMLEAPLFPSELECRNAIPGLSDHLEAEGHAVISSRCVPSRQTGYLPMINYRACGGAAICFQRRLFHQQLTLESAWSVVHP